MSLVDIVITLVGIALAWGVVVLVIGYFERGREQSRGSAEDHNGD